jgi:phospholipid/cholesterol/gamma-HCH transport system substrate-binding protein
MINSKVNYVVVGGFVLAMLLGLMVALAFLTGRTGAIDPYYAIYRNVTGVKFGTQVLYEGYPVGQVEDVTPLSADGKMRFRVDMSIQEGWKIPMDSVAQITSSGLIAAVTISIKAGTNDKALKPGNQIVAQEAANIFSVMSSVAADMNDLSEKSLRPLLDQISQTVASIGHLVDEEGTSMVQDISSLTAEWADRAPKIAANIEEFSTKVNQSSDQLSALMTPENRESIESLIKNMAAATTNMDSLMVSMNDLMKENKKGIAQSVVDLRYVADSMSRHVDSINQNLEGAARNMYEFSRQIRQNPGLLLGGTPPEDEAGR